MKIYNAPREGTTKLLRILTAAIFLVGLLSSCTAPPQATTTPGTATSTKPTDAATPAPESVQTSPEEAKKRKDWAFSMHKKPQPKKGCFTAAYPKTDWQEVPCVAAPNLLFLPRRGPRAFTVGSGNDVLAGAPSGTITQAIGHFESPTNVTSESGMINNTGSPVANAYSLQTNTNFMTSTAACAGAANPATCQGWEQWIFYNNGSSGSVFIQYWLIGYNATCASGWSTVAGGYCVRNSAATNVPNQPITNIGNWTLSGTATAGGDSYSMGTGSNMYSGMGVNAVAASANWTQAEFNIFGPAGGSQANFNNGAQVNTRIEIIYGGNAAPNCLSGGTTGETNNLSFGPTSPPATGPGPAVIFMESTAGGAMSFCGAATTVGDTHLHTFGGLFYDFQASGDFVLAQVDKDFVVQTRQVSGAPTWPDASVNSAVATRMGNDKVAICLPGRLNVDGANNDLGDGQTFSTPDGVQILRRGNVYDITDNHGNSVRAVLNGSYIDVSVGLGHSRANVTGLLANANGNVNQIAARDGTVLTNAFSFDDLYNRFGESWRVSREESLLSVCDDRRVERGNPRRPFFAKDLEPAVYQRTRAVCTAAGVKEGPLLDACTLDVAVIGNDAAAKVFVGARDPIAVGNIVTTSGTAGSVLRLWWLWLLILLLIIALILWILRKKKTTP